MPTQEEKQQFMGQIKGTFEKLKSDDHKIMNHEKERLR